MRDSLKYLHAETTLGRLLIEPFKCLYDLYRFHIVPEDVFIRRKYKRVFGREISLEKPRSLNEKIQWLKLNDRTPLHTRCADKYAVREHVANRIGSEFLIPLILHTRNPADINPEKLPDYPFIIKTTHDSGKPIIVWDKSKLDWSKTRHALKKKLRTNFYYFLKEWPYKNIKPGINVEKLIMDDKGNIPMDYKFYCFNGRVAFITVDVDRFTNRHKRNCYDAEWQLLAMRYGTKSPDPDMVLMKPPCFHLMRSSAETLAKDFYFIRVDLYNLENKVYFGEITFHPGSGFQPYIPPEWDNKLGDMLRLPTDE